MAVVEAARRSAELGGAEVRSSGAPAAGAAAMIAVLQFDAASAALLERLAGEGGCPTWRRCARGEHGSSWRAPPRTSRPAPTRRSTGGSRSATTASSTRSSGRRPSRRSGSPAEFRRRPRSGSGCRARTARRSRSIPTSATRRTAADGALLLRLGDARAGRAASAGPPAGADRALRRRHGRPADVTEVFGAQRPAELRRLRERFLAAPARVADAALEQLRRAPSTSSGSPSPPPTSPATGSGICPALRRGGASPGPSGSCSSALGRRLRRGRRRSSAASSRRSPTTPT